VTVYFTLSMLDEPAMLAMIFCWRGRSWAAACCRYFPDH